jgi:hypothetical protein
MPRGSRILGIQGAQADCSECQAVGSCGILYADFFREHDIWEVGLIMATRRAGGIDVRTPRPYAT